MLVPGLACSHLCSLSDSIDKRRRPSKLMAFGLSSVWGSQGIFARPPLGNFDVFCPLLDQAHGAVASLETKKSFFAWLLLC